MKKIERVYENKIDRVDHMIRENNKKYLDQKSQIQYEKALQQFQKQKKREITKHYAHQIKEGNKKAIEKKQNQLSVNKAKSRISMKSKAKAQHHEEQPQKHDVKPRQKLSQKQVKKVQKAIEARAQRHHQQMQLEKLNKRLQQEKRKTKLCELTETCQKLLSKSHKTIQPISQQIPPERRVFLEQYSKKAYEQVQELDNIISGLIEKSKLMKNKENHNGNNNRGQNQQKGFEGKYKKADQQGHYKKSDLAEDIFSQEFEIEFMNEILSGNTDINKLIDNSKEQSRQNPLDVLFTKSASQLFQMPYIPIN